MPRFSTIKDTLIEFNKMNSQAGTRYRESGLVLRHNADIMAEKELACLVVEI